MAVVATAGHVDHGKSTLVRALTGIEPDRFAEERRRGLTIDLGYAWTTLPSGADVAFVDVPGHERFIANMLAGLGPAPAVLFVVKADGGWSRQSTEHLAAIRALDVRHGVLVVTRSDLADPAPALAEARARLGDSPLGDVEALAVSGVTGRGLADLRDALDRLVARQPAPDPAAPVRLWIDRAFTVRGAGTVVTGTLAAGTLRVGDRLTLRTREVTVRGLQSANRAVETLTGPVRAAVNLRGAGPVERGDVLLTPGAWHRTDTVDVRLDEPDRLPSEAMLHVGTAGVPVRMRPLGEHVARLRLPSALPLRAGDRAVLRDPGRRIVTAGALVLDADPPPLRRRGAAAARANDLANVGPVPDAAREIARRTVVRREHLTRLGIETMGRDDVDGWLVDPPQWARWEQAARSAAAEWATAHPLEPGLPPATLRQTLALPDSTVVLDRVAADAGLRHHAGRYLVPETVVDAAHGFRPSDASESSPAPAADLGPAEAAVRALEATLAGDPFAAPERDELAALGLDHRTLAAAQRRGRLLVLPGDIVLAPASPATAVEHLRALPQPFTASAARQAWRTTRRVAIPLLEHLDDLGHTERADGTRRRLTR